MLLYENCLIALNFRQKSKFILVFQHSHSITNDLLEKVFKNSSQKGFDLYMPFFIEVSPVKKSDLSFYLMFLHTGMIT